MAADPVVLRLETVEADGDRVHAAGHKTIEPPLVEQEAVGHHTPGVLAAVEFEAHLLQIVAQQCLAAGEDDEHLVRVDMRSERVDDAQEVHGGHVIHRRSHPAIAPAVATAHITPQRALPEEGAQRMQLRLRVPQLALHLQSDPLFDREAHGLSTMLSL